MAQAVEEPVDLVLSDLAAAGQLRPVGGVLLELAAEGRERERLQQVEDDALGDRMAYEVGVAGGVSGLPRTAGPARS
ncbi:hypothetical protein [Nocardioides sp. InS609-2]|uniref:hypothetical protein n=1 Tax=Nocardioides sp. InS609-2 TaxID=2760705 RepID=UPI0020BFAF62|nr:hypothetical protein [Nocardioides sp. InS609-2]